MNFYVMMSQNHRPINHSASCKLKEKFQSLGLFLRKQILFSI